MGWTDGIGQQWTMVAPCPEPQMKKEDNIQPIAAFLLQIIQE
jgi:hypothetical protein